MARSELMTKLEATYLPQKKTEDRNPFKAKSEWPLAQDPLTACQVLNFISSGDMHSNLNEVPDKPKKPKRRARRNRR